MPFGRPHLHLASCESTNEIARGLAAAGCGTGTLVTSDEQTAARGRQGRPWSTPPGGALAYSLVLQGSVEMPTTVPLRAGIAVCEVVEALGVPRAMVKWPNDIWIEEKKCAGILVEARPQDGWAVIGIGLNVNVPDAEFPEEFRHRATAINTGATLADATAVLNDRLERWLGAPADELLAELADRDALAGRSIGWQGGEGTATGIDSSGGLIVEDSDGRSLNLDAGEVHLSV